MIREKISEIKKEREEKKAFARKVNKKTLKIRRKAFEKEALKQAIVEGKKLAIKNSKKLTFGQKVMAVANKMADKMQETKEVQEPETKPIEQSVQEINTQPKITVTKKDPFAPTMDWGY